ncbi:phosphoribosylaminoimidazole-succinocarboxamide synthase [Oikeobacillus pervagus]|uniref:Phosphoribosylaminoimidazole-succinocarboxamide synthase n=1 Tax=Oikeobacillus pervagus TaxID=1325931 RepID=A0AAJ1WJL0_9BACI|nr:phosphoribosylaminoimidazolesuccinocarboxamide synthase [Oikeobacillus pervagus]MDQ0215583.1 phosphoribosylaminoimidazole-succinocarboxamide synthase [Oikeobacillus pervagus]
MEKGSLLYEGKAKKIFSTNLEDVVHVEYKDSATAFNGIKKAEITGKGRLNNQISSLIFMKLHEKGIPTHFIKQISDHEQLVKQMSIIPLEVVVRNIAAGSFSKTFGIEEGTRLKQTIVDLYLKSDELGDPLITEDRIEILDIAPREEVQEIKEQALKINDVLKNLFNQINIELIDFKLEFGKDGNGNILLADEISPDTCRLWDKDTNRKLDKDIFRRDLGNLLEAYEEILKRLGGVSICTK